MTRIADVRVAEVASLEDGAHEAVDMHPTAGVVDVVVMTPRKAVDVAVRRHATHHGTETSGEVGNRRHCFLNGL